MIFSYSFLKKIIKIFFNLILLVFKIRNLIKKIVENYLKFIFSFNKKIVLK